MQRQRLPLEKVRLLFLCVKFKDFAVEQVRTTTSLCVPKFQLVRYIIFTVRVAGKDVCK